MEQIDFSGQIEARDLTSVRSNLRLVRSAMAVGAAVALIVVLIIVIGVTDLAPLGYRRMVAMPVALGLALWPAGRYERRLRRILTAAESMDGTVRGWVDDHEVHQSGGRNGRRIAWSAVLGVDRHQSLLLVRGSTPSPLGEEWPEDSILLVRRFFHDHRSWKQVCELADDGGGGRRGRPEQGIIR
ncbi:MAG: hypothetical protein AAGD35_17010 [Actinomycetota bacterium]